MRVLDQPITARLSMHSPSLGNAMMAVSESDQPPPVDYVPYPVSPTPTDPEMIALISMVMALTNEVASLRADLHSRTWLARWRRLWHRLSSWRIRQPAIPEPSDR